MSLKLNNLKIKKMKKIHLLIFSCFFTSYCFSQNSVISNNSFDKNTEKNITENDERILRMNDAYHKNQHNERHYVELARIREADIMWSRKIWREIDLRQKVNHPIYYPQERVKDQGTIDRKNLFDVILSAAIDGDGEGNKLNLYRSGDDFRESYDDEFQSVPMTPDEIKDLIGGKLQPTYRVDQNGEDSLDWNGNLVAYEIDDPDYVENREGEKLKREIKKWLVKEHWFFDKQRSVMDVRIIGICPVYTITTGEENLGEEQELFWVYFPAARKYLKNALAFNMVKNEAENKTFEDIFMKRMFASTIIKEGNVMDRSIGDYMVGLDALLEAERIKEEIFNFEHDLWEY